jgi:hypothetical protein
MQIARSGDLFHGQFRLSVQEISLEFFQSQPLYLTNKVLSIQQKGFDIEGTFISHDLFFELIETGGNIGSGESLITDYILSPVKLFEKGALLYLGDEAIKLLIRHFQQIGLFQSDELP